MKRVVALVIMVGLSLAVPGIILRPAPVKDVDSQTYAQKIQSTVLHGIKKGIEKVQPYAVNSAKNIALAPWHATKYVATKAVSTSLSLGKPLLANYVYYFQPHLTPFVAIFFELTQQLIKDDKNRSIEQIVVLALDGAITAGCFSLLSPLAIITLKAIMRPVLEQSVNKMKIALVGGQSMADSSFILTLKKSVITVGTSALFTLATNITGMLAVKNVTDRLYALGDENSTYYNAAKNILDTMSIKSLLFKDVAHDAYFHGSLERYTTAHAAKVGSYQLLGKGVAEMLGDSMVTMHNTTSHLQDQVSLSTMASAVSTVTGPVTAAVSALALNTTGLMATAVDNDISGFSSQLLNTIGTLGIKNATFAQGAHDNQFHGALERIVTAERFAAEVDNMVDGLSDYIPTAATETIKNVLDNNVAQYAHTVSSSLLDGQGKTGAFGSLLSTNIAQTAGVIGKACSWLTWKN